MKAYRSADDGEITIADGYDICLDVQGAFELADELLEAAYRAERGELDYRDKKTGVWKRMEPK